MKNEYDFSKALKNPYDSKVAGKKKPTEVGCFEVSSLKSSLTTSSVNREHRHQTGQEDHGPFTECGDGGGKSQSMASKITPSIPSFFQCVQNIRIWEDAHLPLSQSYIAYDLFMLIGHSSELQRPMTLKELFNSLKYSERGVRYVLEQFVDGGWCEIVGHEHDKRFRLVVATQRLVDKLAEYEQVVLSKYRL